MSEHYDCTDPDGRTSGISAASAAVRRGELVVLPTDTVYGIGCDAFDATAVASVLAAKGRGRDMPPPVLIPTARTAQGLATQIPAFAQTLMEAFWPGPLTLVLKAQTSLHWDLGDTNGTVALRVPADEVALELLGEIGPMAVTSANTTGDEAARSVDQAGAMLGESVSVYLDGGPSTDGESSTILDCTGESPVTLRLGAIGQAEIDAALVAADADAQEQPDPAEPAEPAGSPEPAEPAEPAESADFAEPAEPHVQRWSTDPRPAPEPAATADPVPDRAPTESAEPAEPTDADGSGQISTEPDRPTA